VQSARGRGKRRFRRPATIETPFFRSFGTAAFFSPFFSSAEAAISCGLPAKTLRKNRYGKLNHFWYENRVQNMWKRA